MLKRVTILLLAALPWAGTAWAAEASPRFTDAEARWLAAGEPVLTYARRQGLPIDIIVQPQDAPGHAPLAMGYDQGRCKLVLSMRGNPAVQSTADSIPAHLFSAVAEAVTAHEIGHCWRYVHGVWHTLPAGFSDNGDQGLDDAELEKLVRDMRETRREEGFADLVGLAWVRLRHPAVYAEVHDWLTRVREHQPVPGAHHDTRAWVRLARQAASLGSDPSVFVSVLPLWKQGLLADEE